MKYTTAQLAQKQLHNKAKAQGRYYAKSQCALTSQQIIEKYKFNSRELYEAFKTACNNRRKTDGKEEIVFTPYDQLNTRQAARKIAEMANNDSIEKDAEHFQLRDAHMSGTKIGRTKPENLQRSLENFFKKHAFYTKAYFERFVAGYNEYREQNRLVPVTISPYESFFPNQPSKRFKKDKEKDAETYRIRNIYTKGYSKGLYAKSENDYREVHIKFPEYNKAEYEEYCKGFQAGININNKGITADNISFDTYNELYPSDAEPESILESNARKMLLRMKYIAGYNTGRAGKDIISQKDLGIPNDKKLYDQWLAGYNHGRTKRALTVTEYSSSESESESESVYVDSPKLVLNLKNANKNVINVNDNISLRRSPRLK